MGGFFGWLLASLAQQVGFPVPEGGAQRLTDALVHRLRAHGGEVVSGEAVVDVVIDHGRARGVRTQGGSEVRADAVLADVVAPLLFRDLVGVEHLRDSYVQDLDRFRYGVGSVKVDWSLDGPIPWACPDTARAGTVHLADSLDALSRYGYELATDQVPSQPFLVLGQMTTADPTRSPPGTESAWAYTHVPMRVRGDAGGDIAGRWDRTDTDDIVERIERHVERWAPGFRSHITARHVFTPATFADANANLVGGSINGGTAQLHQQLVFRPVPGLGRAETPIPGLFLASASAHPGGGVHGACGANAARAALLQARLERLRTTVRSSKTAGALGFSGSRR
jgi:phytoene dehydrogenase-like protein